MDCLAFTGRPSLTGNANGDLADGAYQRTILRRKARATDGSANETASVGGLTDFDSAGISTGASATAPTQKLEPFHGSFPGRLLVF